MPKKGCTSDLRTDLLPSSFAVCASADLVERTSITMPQTVQHCQNGCPTRFQGSGVGVWGFVRRGGASPSFVRTMWTLKKERPLKDRPPSPADSPVAQPLAFSTAKTLPSPSCLQRSTSHVSLRSGMRTKIRLGFGALKPKSETRPHQPHHSQEAECEPNLGLGALNPKP